MIYLIALFLPPLYFLVRKRWAAFLLHGINCAVAVPLFFVFGAGAVLWFISSICAVWDLQRKSMEEHATIMASKMVEAMKSPS